MSYEQNWGFTDPTDEFGAPVPLNDYGSGHNSEESYHFITKINICAEFIGRLNGPCLADRFHRLKIVSDFEPRSPLMVSRCIMENLPGIHANPVEGMNEIIVLDTRESIGRDSFLEAIQATIQLLQESFGLAVVHFDRLHDNENNSVESDTEMDNRDCTFDDVIDCLLNYISHKILETNVWQAFSSDGQKNGVYAKVSADGPTFLDVVAFKGFTLNSDDGSIMLRFQTASHRVTMPAQQEFLPDNDGEESKDNSGATAAATATGVKPLTLILVTTGEEVTIVNGQKSYQGVLLPAKNTDLVDHKRDGATVGKKKKNSVLEKKVPESCVGDVESILLTKYDLKNRARGYSLFLPDNKEKCDEYWRLGYGIKLKLDGKNNDSIECGRETSKMSNETSDGRIQGNYTGYHLTEVTMELGDQRILPTQLLVSSIAMITSRTRRLSLSIAEQFTVLLRDIPLLESVTEPTRLQTGHGISSKTVQNTGSDFTDSHGNSSLAGQISCSLSSRFQTASSLIKNSEKDGSGKAESNSIGEKSGGKNNALVDRRNFDSSNKNNENENKNQIEKKFCFVTGGNSAGANAKRSPFTATANSALPVKKPSKFMIPKRIPGSVIISKINNNSKNFHSSDNVESGKRKSTEIGEENKNSNLPKVIISQSSIGDKNDKTQSNHGLQQEERKRKLEGKKGIEKKEITKKVKAGKLSTISELGKEKDTINTAINNNTNISALGQENGKTLKGKGKEASKIKIVKEKKSKEPVIKKVKELSDKNSESLKEKQSENIATNEDKKKKKNESDKVQEANEEKEAKKLKESNAHAAHTADPAPPVPDLKNRGDDSSGDDSLSLGSENGNNDGDDDDLFFEE